MATASAEPAGLGRDLTALKLPRRLVRGVVVEMDPAHPIPDVGHQCIVATLPGQLQSATEVGGGNAELAGVKRGPSSKIMQIRDGDTEPICDQAGGRTTEHPPTPGQVTNHGVVAGTAAVLIVHSAQDPVRVFYPLHVGHTDTTWQPRRRTGCGG